MSQRKLFFSVLVIVFFLGCMWVAPSSTMATTFKADVLYTNTATVLIEQYKPGAFINVYTEYMLKTYDAALGTLDAFCVEAVPAATSTAEYELIKVDSALNAAAMAAQRFWSGEGLRTGLTKEDYQIVIWELAFDSGRNLKEGKFQYKSGASDLEVIQKYLDSLPDSEAVWPSVQIAKTPVGVNGENRQDYLVRVSEPATMLLLGAGLIGLAAFGRRNLLKKV